MAAATATAATAATRRLRAFKRWMRSQGIDHSDALQLLDHHQQGISVTTLCDLHEGDLVAKIPKASCLTIKTSGAQPVIESAGLEGYLGLSVALMYEKSLGQSSPWFGYLQLLPELEPIPLTWTLEEVDSLLTGTELHKIVKEDMALVYEDWKECILPLLASDSFELSPAFFGVEQYFAAKSLIASRSFEIDDYHGFGMVPLADLFNHKTGAEDVHFTSISSHLIPENDEEDNLKNDVYKSVDNTEDNLVNEYENSGSEQSTLNVLSTEGSSSVSSAFVDDPTVLEMIMVKDVNHGSEVFNTYGYVGNAALLHRYGFTEVDNPYNIVNIDLELVVQWSSSLFSSRHCRMRLSLWRRLDCSGCVSQNSEYFEISSNGEPQVELLILLYIMLLPEDPYCQLDLTVSTAGSLNESLSLILPGHGNIETEVPETIKDLLLTKSVCKALLAITSIRDSLYGSNSFEDDIEELGRSCPLRERKLYHSLMLRTSERRILQKLRAYAAATGAQLSRAVARKKLKRT